MTFSNFLSIYSTWLSLIIQLHFENRSYSKESTDANVYIIDKSNVCLNWHKMWRKANKERTINYKAGINGLNFASKLKSASRWRISNQVLHLKKQSYSKMFLIFEKTCLYEYNYNKQENAIVLFKWSATCMNTVWLYRKNIHKKRNDGLRGLYWIIVY